MAVSENAGESPTTPEVSVEIDLAFVSPEAILKACHWLSRDYVCEMRKRDDRFADVMVALRDPAAPFDPGVIRDAFTTSAIDFALREKIEAKTSGIRDLLLAKAFSESGVLEDSPEGVFGDVVEEAKSDSMFKILSNSEA